MSDRSDKSDTPTALDDDRSNPMPSAFHGIGTMSTALRAFQRALDVTGHNVANVNTPGYSRQTIDLEAADPTQFTYGGTFYLGNGVNVQSISRIRDAFLAARRIQATSEDGRLNSLSGNLSSIQSLMLEPGGASIGDALNQFYNAWSALGSSPSDNGLRQQVQQTGEVLAGRVRGMYSDLQSFSKQNSDVIGSTITQAQNLMNSIAQMNQQIREGSAKGAEPNDLLDQRDQAIQQLSSLLPVKVQDQPDGSVMLFSGQMTLVDQSGATTLPTSYDAAAGTLNGPNGNFQVASGQLAGLFQTQQKITAYKQSLDNFANNLRTQFNSIHATGTNGLGATGQNFFGDVAAGNPQTGAIDFDVDAAIKADPRAIATGVSGNPGDGGLALSMSALRDTQIAALGGKTFGGFYSDFVASVGQDVATTNNMVDTSGSVIQQIDQQIQSVSGVSLDDEMADMLRYQRSYQAAAKALSVFDQTTQDLINMIQ